MPIESATLVTLVVSPTVFEILTFKARKLLVFPTPLFFDAPFGGALEILNEIYRAKTRGMGLPYDENDMINRFCI